MINVVNKVDNFQDYINGTLKNLKDNNETKIIKHVEVYDEKINNFSNKVSVG